MARSWVVSLAGSISGLSREFSVVSVAQGSRQRNWGRMPVVYVAETETGSTATEVGVKQMTAVGMIHMGCFCGADLFYLGNTDDGQTPLEFLESVKARLGPGHFGFFSSANGRYGECPFCGTLFELPDPELLDWLPFTDRRRFAAVLDEIASRLEHKGASPIHGISSARWNAM